MSQLPQTAIELKALSSSSSPLSFNHASTQAPPLRIINLLLRLLSNFPSKAKFGIVPAGARAVSRSIRIHLRHMGNYISCTLSTQTASGSMRSGAKVIFPTGEVREFFTPTNAAELMLEIPNHFLVNSQSLRAGWRFSALNADEDLEMGNVYVMFPMKRLSSTINASDLGPLFLIASSSKKASSSGLGPWRGRVSPGYSDKVPAEGAGWSSEAPKLSLEGIEEFSTPEFMHRMSASRSKKPLLETIAEEPVCSR